ncbi:MAG: nuclear transport factor 2 family protein [Rubrivivax sp.]|nr:nuclear transport factor 2 family protein [Rubrivivax sp.]
MSDHPNTALLQRFYSAFAALDADAMQACYTPGARFRDEAFTLDGAEQIGAMWHMLCDAVRAQGSDVWRLEAAAIDADAEHGRAHWEAHYRFSATGRQVHNVIDAEFEFHDGLIRAHTDRFPFWRWSRQALGAPGWLLGWTPWLQARVRAQAMHNLARYRKACAAPVAPT